MKATVKNIVIREPQKRENFIINLTLNVVAPAVILMQFSGEDWLGAKNGLLLALAFPLVYGLYEFIKERSLNLFSAVGLLGVLATAGIGLLKLSVEWVAIKEAAQPLIIGVAILASLRTPFPFIKTLLSSLVNFNRINRLLQEHGALNAFERRMVLATYILASSFFLSAVLNYVLAKLVVVSQPGTVEFNEELGRMTALSMPVIGIPMVIIMTVAALVLIISLKKQTGLNLLGLLR